MQRRTYAIGVAVFLFGLVSTASAQTYRSRSAEFGLMTGFGTALAVAGDEIYVGRPGEISMFPMPASRPGGVHVFRVGADGLWTETTAIGAPGDVVGGGFGEAIAVGGNTMVVGAPKTNEGRGAIHVFERSDASGQWSHVAEFPSDGEPNNALGQAVAVGVDVIFAGVPGHNDGSGAVRVIRRSSAGTWTDAARLTDPSETEGGRFGAALAVDGDQLIVGAPGPLPLQILGTPPSPKPGAAHVFSRDASTTGWAHSATLTSEEAGVIALGHAVGMVGHRAVVSAPISGEAAGAAFVYERGETGEWVETGQIRPGEGAQGTLLGFSVALDADQVYVGAPSAGGGPGSVRIFEWDEASGTWSEAQRLTARLTGMVTFFGGAVAVGGNTLVAGAPGADFFQGVGLVYELKNGEWAELGPIVNETPGLDAVTGGQVDCDEGGKAGVFGCADVELVSFMPTADLGAKRGISVNDTWGWTDSLTGKEYGIVGRTDATTFIDLSDPSNPVYLGALPLTEGATVNIWRDMKVYKNHAYIVADGAGSHGVQIFNLTQLRNVQNPPAEFTETAHYDGIHSAHNIVINENTGFAYVVGSSMGGETCGGGLHMIDIRTPDQPTFAGCFSDPATGNARTGYSHDAQCIVYNGPDVEHQGKEVCFGANETALSIADVTDKENPSPISSASYPSVTYAHQGWVSDDHKYFFMNDEGDELVGGTPRTRTLVWDIQDLDDPVLEKEFLGPTAASDHNLYVRGNLMYQSNYVSGLRVIDISDPTNPAEVGHFDTVPFGEDTPGFAGSWSNYPYFDSGIIVVTSMWEGVFVLKKRERPLIP